MSITVNGWIVIQGHAVSLMFSIIKDKRMCSPCSSLLCASCFYAMPSYSSLPFLGPYLCSDSLMPYLGITTCPMSYSSLLMSVFSSNLSFIPVFHTLHQLFTTHCIT